MSRILSGSGLERDGAREAPSAEAAQRSWERELPPKETRVSGGWTFSPPDRTRIAGWPGTFLARRAAAIPHNRRTRGQTNKPRHPNMRRAPRVVRASHQLLNPEHNAFRVGSELEALFDLRTNTGSDFSRTLD